MPKVKTQPVQCAGQVERQLRAPPWTTRTQCTAKVSPPETLCDGCKKRQSKKRG